MVVVALEQVFQGPCGAGVVILVADWCRMQRRHVLVARDLEFFHLSYISGPALPGDRFLTLITLSLTPIRRSQRLFTVIRNTIYILPAMNERRRGGQASSQQSRSLSCSEIHEKRLKTEGAN